MFRKFLITLVCFFVLTAYVNGQSTIPNAGFENWSNAGGYNDPDDWGTINSLTSILGVITVSRTTDVHGGVYAIRLESKRVVILSQTAPGITASGATINTSGDVIGGVAFNKRPVALTGWYKYQPTSPDTCSIEARLYRWNSTTQQRDQVGEAVFEQNLTIGSYTQFNAPFTYSLAGAPDTLVIIMLTSSLGDQSPSGSVLFVDDLGFDFCSGFSVSTAATNESAQGANDGAVDAIITAGAAPLTYIWSNGGTTEDILNLPSGNYCITVTDLNGCVDSSCALVSSPSCTGFSVTVMGTNPTVVGGSDGTADATATGGNAPYTFLWSTGDTTEDVVNVPSGNLCVVVTDNAGCIASGCDTLTDPDCSGFSIVATGTDASSGTASDGSVSVTPNNGTAPYQYAWSNTTSGSSLTNVAPGQYCVTVTDSVGCIADDCALVGPDCSGFAVSINTTAAVGVNNGTATANVSGGVAPYTYSWNIGDTTQTITGLGAGTYCVTANDANGCPANACDSVAFIDGIADLGEAGIYIFPNPAQNVITVELKNEEAFRFRLFDTKGKLVKEEVLSSKTNSISLREFPAGNYLVELRQVATGKVFSGKLMKE